MIVFRQNSGLLLMLIPQILVGNTLYPACLRFCIWVLGKFYKKKECRYLLMHSEEVSYKHLLEGKHTIFLVATVFGLIVVQVTLFCVMDWDSEGLKGLNNYEKLIGVLFQSVNSRHTGESIVDISILSQAMLVLFVFMIHIHHTSVHNREEKIEGKSSLLNFNVLNIVVEVISAYGNVGLSTGYSCERQLHREANCENKWIGFVGKWSDEVKFFFDTSENKRSKNRKAN
ncbi:unnamed protein product [Trifolium pratense]|uniref:Uncharacterized protein n=1 Tax=Trifolium pratense TaxID=57577 RepID=A0ACB0LA35_TRIPR|nr:unnamed protein product [Trifolium pratense]